MGAEQKSQFRRRPGEGVIASTGPPIVRELIVPNPKLKLLDQVREVMRLRHYSIRTEQCYCDWIRRYIKFHGTRGRGGFSGIMWMRPRYKRRLELRLREWD